jgi:hypothetical protein
MTIVNVLVRPEVAYACVDTRGDILQLDGSTVAMVMQKMFPLTRLGAVLTGLGFGWELFSVASACAGSQRDFDGLPLELSSFIFEARDRVTAELKKQGHNLAHPLIRNGGNLVLVGPSPERGGAMRCREVEHFNGSTSVQLRDYEYDDPFIAPWDPAWGEAPRLERPEDFEPLARRQVEGYRQMSPQLNVGGDFIMAEIRPDHMRIYKAFEIQ